ncbi:cellulose synthase/poly-beta-1,6-N-acetylglucosamine synthase-like glycosyltransferase [Mycolicibacterium iranicum]|uniref:Cellulose synthase/poly-beta-1,6-N-acetylglucosamine synthase-like glycosyltransferase n=1 Tax=Mycolicibacterium iranicum TaxID=912594 RepID=A0A839Q1L4_MYCIR|nr:glycosyltransferase [Mycolicibacterium iranicum]MBB2989313.1 cellulose synthase/poly-beta-1,6-N-acetylglucosamine synthase-like glycosyltransferase [Mycolicibacterium iranicum]
MPDTVVPAQLPPHLSARAVLAPKALAILGAGAAALIAAALAAPTVVPPVLTTAVALLYLFSTIDRNLLLLRGLRSSALIRIDDATARSIPDSALPVYTVLLPVYDEPSIVANLLNGVGRLDYPADRLEILLLVEEDDIATQTALLDADLQSVRVVIVPHSLPKTKPKACNYGMSLPDLRGEFITIYDAEDIPEPLQLRRAVAAFSGLTGEIGCIQARLGYFNERQNLLTRFFSLEYDQWFGVVLPAVEQSGCVVPLGGTSNHMRAAVWRDIGGWDEFNVTEDADLGVRLARHGYRTLILDSITLEEANSDVINWIRQRSRWYKGYLQTMLVHLRHPLRLRSEIGTKATLRLINMTGGVPLTSALNVVFWSLLFVWIVGRAPVVEVLFPPVSYYICLTLFLIGAPLSVYVGLIVTQALGKSYLWWVALLAPLYWILQSIAALKAIYQLAFRPSYWEKTVHGLAGHNVPGDIG